MFGLLLAPLIEEAILDLVFASEGDTHTVVVDFDEGHWDLSREDLRRCLDEGRDESLTPWEHDGGHR